MKAMCISAALPEPVREPFVVPGRGDAPRLGKRGLPLDGFAEPRQRAGKLQQQEGAVHVLAAVGGDDRQCLPTVVARRGEVADAIGNQRPQIQCPLVIDPGACGRPEAQCRIGTGPQGRGGRQRHRLRGAIEQARGGVVEGDRQPLVQRSVRLVAFRLRRQPFEFAGKRRIIRRRPPPERAERDQRPGFGRAAGRGERLQRRVR
jgi:hypothetical protein